MEIAPGIHRITCMFGNNRMVFVHLLIGSKAAMLVDTACAHNPAQEILPYMSSIGFDPHRLTYIVISHSDIDHQGGNQPMKEAAPQALLVCHNLDRPWIESTEALIRGRYSQFEQDHGIGYGEQAKVGMRADTLSWPLDLTLEGGEWFSLSPDWAVQAVHTPGHTWGHTAIYDPRSKTMIAGETALSTAILDVDWKPALPPTYCYVDTYLSTIDRVAGMDIDIYSSAHWPLKHGPAVAEFLRESRNYCQHVEQQLLDFAHERDHFTLKEAIDTLGPRLGDWPPGTVQDFSYGMAGNLSHLTERGLLHTARNPEGRITWSLTNND
jgi:glyoxylase-like metal-dependent hydrolase (beta-lactamase superfamily II)